MPRRAVTVPDGAKGVMSLRVLMDRKEEVGSGWCVDLRGMSILDGDCGCSWRTGRRNRESRW